MSTVLIRSPLAQAMRQSPIPALRKLAVEETDSAVVITGSVSSYYLKQLAQEVVLAAAGAVDLVNSVRVTDNSQTDSSQDDNARQTAW